jgi:hypothetical protein
MKNKSLGSKITLSFDMLIYLTSIYLKVNLVSVTPRIFLLLRSNIFSCIIIIYLVTANTSYLNHENKCQRTLLPVLIGFLNLCLSPKFTFHFFFSLYFGKCLIIDQGSPTKSLIYKPGLQSKHYIF